MHSIAVQKSTHVFMCEGEHREISAGDAPRLQQAHAHIRHDDFGCCCCRVGRDILVGHGYYR